MSRFLVALLTFLCSAPAWALTEVSLPFAGGTRSYFIHVPASYTGASPVPLVADLHGTGGRGDIVAADHGWLPLSDQHGFIAVFPNGGEPVSATGFGWNNYWQEAAPNDAEYLAAVLAHVAATHNIDRTRIYMAGHSDGAAMCNTFAAFYSDLLAAAAPVNGNWLTTFGLPETLLVPNAPLPIWTWRGERETQLTGLETRSVQDAKQKAYWLRTLRAGPEQPPVSSSDGTFSYLDEIYLGGTAEYRFTVEVGQHHPFRPQYAARIWNEFFSRHARPAWAHPAAPPAPTVHSRALARSGIGQSQPWFFYGWAGAPDGSGVTLESSPDLATWTPFATATVLASHRAHFMRDHGTGAAPARHFYRARVSPAPVVAPAEGDVAAGGTLAFAIANGVGATWSVVEPGGGSITGAGLYSAPAAAGTYHVRATSPADPARFAEARVRVVAVSPAELARFAAAADYSDSVQGDGLLVLKEGAVVFERYAGATTATTAHLLASGTKSFSAALFALGLADGLWTLDENVSQTITEWQGDARKSLITIRHLLTLTSGLRDSDAYSAPNAPNLDTYDLAINHSTTPQPPGAACIYAPSNFQVFAALFERKTDGRDPLEYLHARLFAPLGMSAASLALWTRDVRGKPQMAGGAFYTAREWAAYGKLWLRGGQWSTQTLLDPPAMRLATSIESPAFLGYGLTWWLNRDNEGTYTPGLDNVPIDGRGDGTQIATNAPADMFMAAGSGKQRLYVIPSQGLVIVRFGKLANSAFTDHALFAHLLGVP